MHACIHTTTVHLYKFNLDVVALIKEEDEWESEELTRKVGRGMSQMVKRRENSENKMGPKRAFGFNAIIVPAFHIILLSFFTSLVKILGLVTIAKYLGKE